MHGTEPGPEWCEAIALTHEPARTLCVACLFSKVNFLIGRKSIQNFQPLANCNNPKWTSMKPTCNHKLQAKDLCIAQTKQPYGALSSENLE